MTDYTDFPQQDSDLESGDMFASPIAVPAPNIDEGPLKCLAVNEEYAKIIALALERLLYHDAWTGTDADVQRVTQQFEHIIGQLQIGDCLDTGGCEQPQGDCVEIGAFHPSIGYFPNHPILQPNYVHPGYAAPAWRRGPQIPGYSPDDAMIDPFSLDLFATWDDLWQSGVPSWTLSFEGTGEIDVEFMMQAQGGMVWIFPDGNPLAGDLVDLNWRALDEFNSTDIFFDILNILQADPGIFTRVHSVEFLTTGPHTLTAWYLPVGDLDPPWAFIGGGMRSIQLCGDITLVEDEVVAYTLVQNGCTVELQADGVPVSTIQVMTPEPSCDFENTVTVKHDAPNSYDMISGHNTNDSPGVNTGVGLDFHANSDLGIDQLQGFIGSGWENIGLARGELEMGVGVDNINYRVLRITAGTRAVQIEARSQTAHVQALRLVRIQQQFNSTSSFDIYNGNRLLHAVGWDGVMQLNMLNSDPQSSRSALVINGFNDGSQPQSGFGVGIELNLQSSTIEGRRAAAIIAEWANPTDANRSAEVKFQAGDLGGLRSVIRMKAAAGETYLGVHGNAPVTRPLVTGTSEYEVLLSLVGALHTVGYISNGTTLIPDSGGGGPTVTTELHTEIYRDFRQSHFGVYEYGVGDNGQWASTLGWVPGEDGFGIALNHDPDYEFIRYRVVYEANFIVPVYIQHGFNVSGLYQEPLTKLIGAGQATYTDEVMVERRGGTGIDAWQFTAVGLDDQGQTPYDPAQHGSITVQSLDLDVRGYGTFERDTWYWDVYPFFIRRETRYSNLKALSDWIRQPGGEY